MLHDRRAGRLWARRRRLGFLVLFQGFDSLRVAAETLYSGLNDFTLVSIPMFIMMGAAIGSSPAGRDLYIALDRWLYRVPGGLVISNIGACALFAALTGSSPATCAAIGKMGIPEMRKRGYPDEVATGSICAGGTLGILIPPSITFILYGIATETSIGRLFLAGVLPGLLLTGLFMLWTLFYIWKQRLPLPTRRSSAISWKEKFAVDPESRALPRDRHRGDVRALRRHRDAVGSGRRRRRAVRRSGDPDLPACGARQAWWEILRSTTRESVMILMIIATAVLFGYMLTSLYITQTLAAGDCRRATSIAGC